MDRVSKLKLLEQVFNDKNSVALHELISSSNRKELLKITPCKLSDNQIESCLEYLSQLLGKPYERGEHKNMTDEQIRQQVIEIDKRILDFTINERQTA